MSKHAITINGWVLLPTAAYSLAVVVALHGIETGSLSGAFGGAMGMAGSYFAMVSGSAITRDRHMAVDGGGRP